MAYIGTSPSNGVRRVHTYTATAGQTTFTGSSTEGVTLTYADTNYIDVFQNGILLGSADYTSTSGTSVVLAQGASVSDLVVIVVYDVFSVADTVSKTSGGSFDSAVTMSGALSSKGGAVFNEDSVDVDFRVESNGNANMLFVDGGNDKVGIGTNAPDGLLTIQGDSNSGAQPSIRLKDGTDAREVFLTNESGDLVMGTSNSSDDVVDSSINILTGLILLKTANTERMRFDDGGHIMINSTAVSGAAKLTVKFPDASEECIVCLGTDNASGSGFVVFRKANGTTIGQIKKNGTSDAVQYVTSSDYRLKENVDYTFDATTRVKQLKPARFNFISDPTNTVVDGFLAHEVSSIVPEAIDGDKDATQDISNVVLHADGEVVEENVTEAQWTAGKSDGTYAANTTWVASKTVPKYQGIDQSKLVPLLVKTIQELEARITALESA